MNSVENWYFYPTKDLDLDNTSQQRSSLKHFQTKYFLHCHFDFQCLRFFFKITNITFLIKPLSGMYEELFSDISGVTTLVTIHALDP